jgi:Uma2 family endonuclease
MASHPEHFYTPDEYLALERKAAYKSEYYAGEIFAMSGASREHSIIVGNVTTELNIQLETPECELYPTGMRVRAPDTTLYTYPDLVVVCGQPQFEDESVDTLLNPSLIVEVLSPSTEAYDRARKFANYREIESLREYVLIAQKECRVTQFIKQHDGDWLFREAGNIEESIHLPSIKCNLRLARVYRKIQLPQLP